MTTDDFTEAEKTSYLGMAYDLAHNSPDLSTQLGAVLMNKRSHFYSVIGIGWNTLPRGVKTSDERLSRPTKYLYTEHAERNAIFDAARRGHATEGSTMFCPWFACADCGRAIIQSGVKKVIGHKAMFDGTPDRWKDSIAEAFVMFGEAGVQTEIFDGYINAVRPLRFNEELWTPSS